MPQKNAPTFKRDLAKPGKCRECGEEFFQQCIRFLFVPGFANSSGRDIGVPEDYFICVACGSINTINEIQDAWRKSTGIKESPDS
jgi:hypothetical protein